MVVAPSSTITEHLASLTDPRINHTKRHQLLDLLTIALCAVISGADEWVVMVEYGNAKREWLDTFRTLPNGISSHDTFGRVFAALDPDEFGHCFLGWVQSAVALTEGAVIAVDGRTVRRSHDRGAGKTAIHRVSAWASADHLVLGQVNVDEKSKDAAQRAPAAIPALLDVLLLKGCIVTIDAMGCQAEIAAQIVPKGADYVLALQENQESICREVVHLFTDAHATGGADYTMDVAEMVDGGHGWMEIRRCWTISDPVTLAHVDPDGRWAGLRAIGKVEAERRGKGKAGKATRKTRYYLTSLADVAAFGRAVWCNVQR